MRPAAVLIVAVILAACATNRPAKQPRVGGNRLVFELPDLSGQTVSSDDDRFTNKVLLVTLWGSWCPPCVSEIPTFNDLQTRYGHQGLEIVAIAFEKEADTTSRREQLRAFAQQHAIDYLVLDGGATTDFSNALPMVDDVEGFPVEILVGRNGAVVDARNGFGYSERWAQELETRLQELLEARR